MKIIALSGVVGAVVSSLGFTAYCAVCVFINGATLGPCAGVRAYTLGAAIFGAALAMRDCVPVSGLGLLAGAALGAFIVAVRRGAKSLPDEHP